MVGPFCGFRCRVVRGFAALWRVLAVRAVGGARWRGRVAGGGAVWVVAAVVGVAAGGVRAWVRPRGGAGARWGGGAVGVSGFCVGCYAAWGVSGRVSPGFVRWLKKAARVSAAVRRASSATDVYVSRVKLLVVCPNRS